MMGKLTFHLCGFMMEVMGRKGRVKLKLEFSGASLS
jgi:hypothetical protein